MNVDSEDGRRVLLEHGAEIDDKTRYVKLPEDLIKNQLKKVPNSFSLHGSDGSFKVDIDTKQHILLHRGLQLKFMMKIIQLRLGMLY